MFRCSVCGVSTSSEKNLQDHFRGRGHLKALDRQRLVERSVFVRGFGNETSSASLQTLLEKYVGTVDKVWVSDNVSYAMVEFKDPSDALRALKLTGLQLEGKKLVIKPRKLEIKKAEKPRRRTPTPDFVMKTELEKQLAGLDVFISEDKMKEIPEIEDQLQYLNECNKMTDQNIEKQLQIAFQLLKVFRPFYPHCLVVPFGSIISGPGTRVSDCDFCLVRDPVPHLAHVLTGPRYFPPQLMPIVRRLEEESGRSMSPGKGGATPPTVPSAPPPKSKAVPRSKEDRLMENKALLSMASKVIRDINATRIQPIPHARCPIVKFYHEPTGLQCDLGVDQCLGPLNSRLLRYYCEFDSRVATIVSSVKLWRCMMKIPKVKLNSYALSLMVIYSLQRCSPPVLPCLQDPVDWPRNMEYFQTIGRQEFNDRDNPWRDTPWNCGFTSPQSLLPSTNKESTVSLLLQFFKFYSQQFNFAEHVVSIRSSREAGLTRREAVDHSVMAGVTPRAMEDFILPDLVVQDPFDLAHNVTRALHPKDFKSLLNGLNRSYHLLKDLLARPASSRADQGTSLLSIFDDRFDAPLSQPKGAILFTLQRVASLLCQKGGRHEMFDGMSAALAKELEETALSLEVKERLGVAVFGELIHLLTTKYGFVCEESAESAKSEEPGGAPVGVRVEEGVEAGVSSEGGEQANGASSRKRNRASIEEDLPEELTASKRGKGGDEDLPSGVLQSLLTRLPPSRGKGSCYICTVWEKTWASARRKRREALKAVDMEQMDTKPSSPLTLSPEPGSGPSTLDSTLAPELKVYSTPLTDTAPSPSSSLHVQGMADCLPSPGGDEGMEGASPSSPVLRIKVTQGPPVSWVTDKVCAVQVDCEEGKRQEFLNFLALLRKELYSLHMPTETHQTEQ